MRRLQNRGVLAGAAAVAALSLVGTFLAFGPANLVFAETGGAEERPQMAHRLWVAWISSDSGAGSGLRAGTGVNAPATGATNVEGCPLLIYEALGEAGCRISFCESSWNANVTGPGGTVGWFQIHPDFHADATHDPAGNVAAAARISNGGTDWSAWGVLSVLETGVCPSGVGYPG